MRFLNIWLFTLVAGVYFAGLMTYTTPEALRKREVAQHGQLVLVRVTRLFQVHLGKTHSYYLDFRYQGRSQSIRVGRSDLEQATVGRYISLRHLECYPDLFLPSYETMTWECISQILIFLGGLYAAFYSIKRLREAE